MAKFRTLLGAEQQKLWKRLSTKLMLAIAVVLLFGVTGLQFAMYHASDKSASDGEAQVTYSIGSTSFSAQAGSDWKDMLRGINQQLQSRADAMEKSESLGEKAQLDSLNKSIAENAYRIDHNIEPSKNSDAPKVWESLMDSNLWYIVALLAIIACSGLVAGEFSDQTMKTMIVRPYSRWQILTAKLITVVVYTAVLTAACYAAFIAGLAVFFGGNGLSGRILLWFSGGIHDLPGFGAALYKVGLDFLSALIYVLLAFALCTVARSRALATGLSIFLMFAGSMVSLLARNFSFGKYIFFADTDFSTFLTRGAPFYGITLGLALLICAVTGLVFLFAGYFSFIKRDIA